MQIHPDYSQHELFAKAEYALEKSDYLQAITYYEELMQVMSGKSEAERLAFFSGPYLDLTYKTGNYANMLADCGYFLQAYDLVCGLMSRVKNSGDANVINWLNNLENECLRNVFFSRKSSKINDVIICGAADSTAEVQRPIIDALHKLGVSVQPNPYPTPIDGSDYPFRDIPVMSDAIVVILSPGFFSSNWPKEELYEIVNNTGDHSIQVIPIWHAITRPEVLAASEPLEKILSFETNKKDISEIAQGIADIVRPDLTSDVLHKIIWASSLQGKNLAEGLTDFKLAKRHQNLDESLVERIRLIRAVFLDGNRQMMKSWIHGFSCELEPHTAVGEWEKLACVFQEIKIAQRHTNILKDEGSLYKKENNWIREIVDKNINLFADSMSVNSENEDGIRNQVTRYFLELASFSSDRIFTLVWMTSQPILKNINIGFEQWIREFTEIIFFNTPEPLFEPADDWVADMSARNDGVGIDKSFNPSIKFRDAVSEGMVKKENSREGILHTDEERPWTKEWDVFISHASEDKAELVRPLAEALKDYGVRVWYDSFTLKPGKILGDTIFKGIDASEFGIIVLSQNFIKKEWPRKEYEVLRKQQSELGDRLITLWYKLTPEERPDWIKDFCFNDLDSSSNQSITALTMLVLEKIRPDLALFIQKKLSFHQKLDEPDKDKLKETNFLDIGVDVSPPKYDKLPQGLVQRIRLARSILYDNYHHSLKFWIDGYLRDHDPEKQVEYFQGIASMYLEAIMLVDFIEKNEPKSFTRFFRPKQLKINHQEIYRMIVDLTNFPSETLLKMQQKYPEKIVNSIWNIVSSPTVVDVLDPD